MQLGLSTWAEVERYLAESDGIIIPIGSTEQHGPNGLIGTDAICAEAVAHGIGDQTGAVVAPVLAFGMAQHHMGFPGTVTLRASTLILVLRDVVTSLAAHGFRRFCFVNGHGGNIAIAHSAFAEIYAQSSLSGEAGELRCTLRNWWLRPAVTEIVAELYGDREGHHATPSEVPSPSTCTPPTSSGSRWTRHRPPIWISPTPWISGGVSPMAASARTRRWRGRNTASACWRPSPPTLPRTSRHLWRTAPSAPKQGRRGRRSGFCHRPPAPVPRSGERQGRGR